MAEPQPTIRPTKPGHVLAAVGAGAAAGWLLAQGLLLTGGTLPVLEFSAWLPMLLLAAVTGWLAWVTWRTVQRRREALEARAALARLLFGKASVLAGAVLGAGYLALVGVALGGWPAPLAQGRVLHGALATATSAAWAAAGWFLERACRIPGGDDDDGSNRRPGVGGGDAADEGGIPGGRG